MKKPLLSNSQPGRAANREGPRVLYLGTYSDFSVPPLDALLADGLPVCAVAMPGPDGPPSLPATGRVPLPMLVPSISRTIAHVAWPQRIPVLRLGALTSPKTLEQLAALQPDVICVACFPWRLPQTILDLPPLGCLNLHPSLLPAYRGPSPGFWVLRNDERVTGATVHLMDAHFDRGDMLLQQAFEIPDGMTTAALEQECANIGAPLMVQAVRALAAGTATRTPQPTEGSSYYSWPQDDDFSIPTTRPARWAFNFLRGVSEWGSRLELRLGAKRFTVQRALGYQPDEVLDQPYRLEGKQLWVQCTPGVLHVVV